MIDMKINWFISCCCSCCKDQDLQLDIVQFDVQWTKFCKTQVDFWSSVCPCIHPFVFASPPFQAHISCTRAQTSLPWSDFVANLLIKNLIMLSKSLVKLSCFRHAIKNHMMVQYLMLPHIFERKSVTLRSPFQMKMINQGYFSFSLAMKGCYDLCSWRALLPVFSLMGIWKNLKGTS